MGTPITGEELEKLQAELDPAGADSEVAGPDVSIGAEEEAAIVAQLRRDLVHEYHVHKKKRKLYELVGNDAMEKAEEEAVLKCLEMIALMDRGEI